MVVSVSLHIYISPSTHATGLRMNDSSSKTSGNSGVCPFCLLRTVFSPPRQPGARGVWRSYSREDVQPRANM